MKRSHESTINTSSSHLDKNSNHKIDKKEPVYATEDLESSSAAHVRQSMQIIIFGVPTFVNKKIFKIALTKIYRKDTVEIELLKEVSFLIITFSPPSL